MLTWRYLQTSICLTKPKSVDGTRQDIDAQHDTKYGAEVLPGLSPEPRNLRHPFINNNGQYYGPLHHCEVHLHPIQNLEGDSDAHMCTTNVSHPDAITNAANLLRHTQVQGFEACKVCGKAVNRPEFCLCAVLCTQNTLRHQTLLLGNENAEPEGDTKIQANSDPEKAVITTSQCSGGAMKWSLFAQFLFFVTFVSAHARDRRWDEWCVDSLDAQDWLDRYQAFENGTGSDLGDARATGEAIISDKFEVFCNSCAFSRAIEAGEENRKLMPRPQATHQRAARHWRESRIHQRNIEQNVGLDSDLQKFATFLVDHSDAKGYPVRGFAAFTVRKNPDPNGKSALVATRLESELNDFARGLNRRKEYPACCIPVILGSPLRYFVHSFGAQFHVLTAA
ncbi:uncharacterized protein MYCFIDRAFT_177919 [Pseudocercospora fijiensis CIRAD86]|uniref:Uncharacterized protein n=1 Tax=Pseudocercospora fijiensis (strain CIRAD86) TaxID=383855 RepID=M2YNL4_PSEFD|nr:uncharacterized protein MYCFIDRAFT_177919 [Pseudocercospora fijiensis CIRAD86]EME79295.1 hypothetical protein MYCFIDRAFT_177919 [Pseudocercospora fijiensis CIRAD86]